MRYIKNNRKNYLSGKYTTGGSLGSSLSGFMSSPGVINTIGQHIQTTTQKQNAQNLKSGLEVGSEQVGGMIKNKIGQSFGPVGMAVAKATDIAANLIEPGTDTLVNKATGERIDVQKKGKGAQATIANALQLDFAGMFSDKQKEGKRIREAIKATNKLVDRREGLQQQNIAANLDLQRRSGQNYRFGFAKEGGKANWMQKVNKNIKRLPMSA